MIHIKNSPIAPMKYAQEAIDLIVKIALEDRL